MEYTIKMVTGPVEKPYPCEGYTVTSLPEEGFYRENPEVIGLPKGQKVKFVLDPTGQTLYIPRDGRKAYVMQKGETIDKYPKERKKGLRVTKREKDGE